MHTDAQDPHGQDLPHILEHLKITDGQVLLSTEKVDPRDLAAMYNMADYTINISDAEGFGLATLESLACGTPIIVNMTGGLQEQVTNGKEWFGWGIQPCSKTVIGSTFWSATASTWCSFKTNLPSSNFHVPPSD